MEYSYEIYPVADGYGFHILCDGTPTITQDYHPRKEGSVAMTMAEAELEASIILERVRVQSHD